MWNLCLQSLHTAFRTDRMTLAAIPISKKPNSSTSQIPMPMIEYYKSKRQ
jgi:hypothetical protein